MRVLIVEDEKTIGEHIQTSLRDCGFTCNWVTTGKEALELCAVEEFDCIVLDRMLPDFDGLEVCRNIRAENLTVPILFLTALSGVDQKVMGLNSGGDDYLTKPFDIDELIARVNALVRRASFKQQVQLVIRSIKLDTQRLQVKANGTVLSLSNREFRLLEYLMRNAGRPVTRSQILEHVWDYNMDADSNMVDVYINYLRKKIDTAKNQPSNIETVRGYGYRFRDND